MLSHICVGAQGSGGLCGGPRGPRPAPASPAGLPRRCCYCCSHHRPARPRPAHSAVLPPTHTVVVNLLVIEWPSSLTETRPSLKVTLGEVALGLTTKCGQFVQLFLDQVALKLIMKLFCLVKFSVDKGVPTPPERSSDLFML